MSFDFTIFNNSNKRFLKVCFATVQLSNEESFDDQVFDQVSQFLWRMLPNIG